MPLHVGTPVVARTAVTRVDPAPRHDLARTPRRPVLTLLPCARPPAAGHDSGTRPARGDGPGRSRQVVGLVAGPEPGDGPEGSAQRSTAPLPRDHARPPPGSQAARRKRRSLSTRQTQERGLACGYTEASSRRVSAIVPALPSAIVPAITPVIVPGLVSALSPLLVLAGARDRPRPSGRPRRKATVAGQHVVDGRPGSGRSGGSRASTSSSQCLAVQA